MQQTRKVVQSVHLKAKGSKNKVVVTMAQEISSADKKCAEFIAKIDAVELDEKKVLLPKDIEGMEGLAEQIGAKAKAIDAIVHLD